MIKLKREKFKNIIIPKEALKELRGYSAYEIAKQEGFTGTLAEWLESLKGAKGDKGDAFVYADFTEEQLELLKGPKGDKGEKGDTPSVPNTAYFLKENFVYLPDENLDTVLLTLVKMINNSSTFITSYNDIQMQYPFTCEEFYQGDTTLIAHGCDHFKVRVNNGEAVEIIDNVAEIPVGAINDNYLTVEYIDLVGNVRDTQFIEVLNDNNATEEEYDLGAGTFILKGKSATIKTKATGTNFTIPSALKTKLDDIVLRNLTIDFAVKNPNKIEADLYFVPKVVNIINWDHDEFNINLHKSVNYRSKLYQNGKLIRETNLGGSSLYDTHSGVVIGSII